MNRHNEIRSNSDIYARINTLPLTPAERVAAIHGLNKGAMIADAILWAVNGINRLLAGAALKPSLKH